MSYKIRQLLARSRSSMDASSTSSALAPVSQVWLQALADNSVTSRASASDATGLQFLKLGDRVGQLHRIAESVGRKGMLDVGMAESRLIVGRGVERHGFGLESWFVLQDYWTHVISQVPDEAKVDRSPRLTRPA